MYVPAAGTLIENDPLDDVVTVGSGEAGTPHGIDVADSPVKHVAAFGTLPTVTVKPASPAPETYSCAIPLTLSSAAVGVGDAVGALVGDTVGVPVGTTVAPLPPLDPPPPPHETIAKIPKMRTPHTLGFISSHPFLAGHARTQYVRSAARRTC